MHSVAPEEAVKWKARDGYLCAIALILVSLLPNEALWFAYRHSQVCAAWLAAHSNLTQGGLLLVQSGLSLLTVYLFARAFSPRRFFANVGMAQQPTILGWCAAWAGIGIGLLAIYGTYKEWIPPSHVARDFFSEGGVAKLFFIVYGVLIAPFSEEVVRRGFLYQAFRGSYKPLLSTALVLAVHAFFHWGLISRSVYTSICLVLVEALLCVIREKTKNVWNCVLCHGAYNATQGLPLHVCLVGLILLLPYCAYRRKAVVQ